MAEECRTQWHTLQRFDRENAGQQLDSSAIAIALPLVACIFAVGITLTLTAKAKNAASKGTHARCSRF